MSGVTNVAYKLTIVTTYSLYIWSAPWHRLQQFPSLLIFHLASLSVTIPALYSGIWICRHSFMFSFVTHVVRVRWHHRSYFGWQVVLHSQGHLWECTFFNLWLPGWISGIADHQTRPLCVVPFGHVSASTGLKTRQELFFLSVLITWWCSQ